MSPLLANAETVCGARWSLEINTYGKKYGTGIVKLGWLD